MTIDSEEGRIRSQPESTRPDSNGASKGARATASADGSRPPESTVESTVIVDPSLREDVADESEEPNGTFATPEAEASGEGPERDDREAEAHQASATRPLSFAEAERFAAAIRPSWDPPGSPGPDDADAIRSEATPPPAPPTATPQPPARPEARVSDLPGARPQRHTALFALAVVGSIALLGLMVWGGGDKTPPQPWQPQRASEQVAPAESTEPTATTGVPSAKTAQAEPPEAPTKPSGEAAGTSVEETAPETGKPGGTSAKRAPVAAADSSPEGDDTQSETQAKNAGEQGAGAEEPSPQEPEAPPSGATAEPARAEAQPANPDSEPTPEYVHIRVTARPHFAQLKLDGREVPNPFDVRVEKREGIHWMVAEAPGYKQRSVRLDFDRDRKVSLRLRKVRRTAQKSRDATREKPKAPPERATEGAGFVSESPY